MNVFGFVCVHSDSSLPKIFPTLLLPLFHFCDTFHLFHSICFCSQACRNRLQSYPWDAHWVHKVEKTTPLHLVCVYRAPVEVVQKLVDANPSAITARNDSGWTPLHLIVLHGSDPEVAILLIQRGGVEACSVETPFSGSPLHLACFHGTSKDVLRAIVAANPSMVSRGASSSASGSGSYDTSGGGKKPAEHLWHRFCRNPTNKDLLAIVGNNSINSRKQMTVHQVANTQELLGQIQILMDGLAGNFQQQRKTDGINNRINTTSPNFLASPFNDQIKMMSSAIDVDDMTAAATTGAVIYQIINNQPEIGDLNDFLEVSISSFPESHLQYVDPKTGNWLLHAACSRPPLTLTRRRTNRAATTSSPHSDNNDRDLTEILVDVLPSAVAVKNNDGDYPLHLAISKGRRTWRTGISSLVKARSQLVHVRDRESGLYPFQLAASVAGRVVDESAATETIFQLLLSCPHILTEG